MRSIPYKLGMWLVISICFVSAGEMMAQEDSVQYVRRTDRLRYIAFVPAKQRCENWAIASAVQSTLEMGGFAMPQSTLVTKLSGNDTCGPNFKRPAELANLIQGDYKLASGRTVRVEAKVDDTYVEPGRLVGSIRGNRPFLWIWNNHVYMAAGITYVDAVHTSGLHEYDIQQIELMDPFAGAEQQPTIFQKTRTTLGQVGRIIEITVSP